MIVALFSMPLLIFQTLGSVDNYEGASQNAVTWNATLNGSATFFNITPAIIIVIVVAAVMSYMCIQRGYG